MRSEVTAASQLRGATQVSKHSRLAPAHSSRECYQSKATVNIVRSQIHSGKRMIPTKGGVRARLQSYVRMMHTHAGGHTAQFCDEGAAVHSSSPVQHCSPWPL